MSENNPKGDKLGPFDHCLLALSERIHFAALQLQDRDGAGAAREVGTSQTAAFGSTVEHRQREAVSQQIEQAHIARAPLLFLPRLSGFATFSMSSGSLFASSCKLCSRRDLGPLGSPG